EKVRLLQEHGGGLLIGGLLERVDVGRAGGERYLDDLPPEPRGIGAERLAAVRMHPVRDHEPATAGLEAGEVGGCRDRGRRFVELALGLAARNVEWAPEPDRLRNVGKEIVDRGDADRREHLRAVALGR